MISVDPAESIAAFESENKNYHSYLCDVC